MAKEGFTEKIFLELSLIRKSLPEEKKHLQGRRRRSCEGTAHMTASQGASRERVHKYGRVL